MNQMTSDQDQESAKALLYIGCAGWSLPKPLAGHFPDGGSHLERYATRLNGVEINSSFYHPHQRKTYIRWAASVPDSFRFSVKVPKSITHENRLQDTEELLDKFLEEVAGLGTKLGLLLVQLPPSLRFDHDIAARFFSTLRGCYSGQVVCEPRHLTWFRAKANDLLNEYQVARVVADPEPVTGAHENGDWKGLTYYRLHGSPTIYRSAYTAEFLANLAAKVEQDLTKPVPTWCIFDNTSEGAATGNALELVERLQ